MQAEDNPLSVKKRSGRNAGGFEKIQPESYNTAMQKNDDKQIAREFWLRQGRQFLAIAIALFLVLLLAIVYKRQDLFGEYSKNTIFAAQLAVIAVFISFTAFNWRCPSCRKYLGRDINKRVCRHCRARLR